MNASTPILHIAPTPFFADRGCHIRIEGIARSLEAIGHSSIVCTYHHGRDINGVNTRRISPIRHYTQTSAGPNLWKLWADLKLLVLVIKQIHATQPRFVHAHLHEGLFIALIARMVFFWRKLVIVADLQGSFTGELDSHGAFSKLPFMKPVAKLFERIIMWFPHHIVCSSQRSLDLFVNDFGVNERRISLAQDGAREASELSDQVKESLLAQYNLPSDRLIAVYSGALLGAKGLEQLQELISRVVEKGIKLHFLIIGYPTDDLDAFLQQNTLGEHCTITGQIAFEELPKMLQLCDIAIDPKNFDAGEGSGKILNYLAAGLPVLAFATPNNKTFLPENAPLCNTVEDMAEQAQTWCADSNARRGSAKNNKQHFKANYSWQVTEKQLNNVYKDL